MRVYFLYMICSRLHDCFWKAHSFLEADIVRIDRIIDAELDFQHQHLLSDESDEALKERREAYILANRSDYVWLCGKDLSNRVVQTFEQFESAEASASEVKEALMFPSRFILEEFGIEGCSLEDTYDAYSVMADRVYDICDSLNKLSSALYEIKNMLEIEWDDYYDGEFDTYSEYYHCLVLCYEQLLDAKDTYESCIGNAEKQLDRCWACIDK